MIIQLISGSLAFLVFNSSCQESSGSKNENNPGLQLTKQAPADTVPAKKSLKPYHDLTFVSRELLMAAPGTKSVLFNSAGTRLFAMNLEGMSIYEFDQATRKVVREFKFKKTPGIGWDYAKERSIKSFQEKPVEAAMSHQDKILWVSLHNAEGIVPIIVDSVAQNKKQAGSQPQKLLLVTRPEDQHTDSIYVPLIHTGKTPKVIAVTKDNQYLLVSNWHSYNVSVLSLNPQSYPYGKLIATVPVSSIPRGIAIDEKTKKSYVSIMGGASIAVIDNNSWDKTATIPVASNPRHVVMDTLGRIFVSYNKLARIAAIDAATGKTLFSATTHAQPRTIILSKNHQFIFVTCYSSNYVDVFKIHETGFTKVASLPCSSKPVGVDIFETDNTLEAWVCSYSNGSISVFSFKKD